MSTNSMTDHCILTGINCTTSITTPQFIDTFHCLCAIEPSRASTDSTTELWRCISNATDEGTAGGNTGKWWHTVNANSNLEGFTEPLNSASDPPDLGKAYMLADDGDGGTSYAEYNGTEGCTAKNDTQASAQYYGKRERAASANSTGSTSTATSTNTSPSHGGPSSITVLPTPTATPLVSSSPTQTDTASANGVSLNTVLLFGLCFSTYASLFLR